jgi:lysophospholipase L1-like esterase
MRTTGAKILLAMLSLLVTFAALELAFRALDYRGFHANRRHFWQHAMAGPHERVVGMQFKPYASFRHEYDSNPRGYFDEDNGLTYTVNRYGHRGPDFALPKPRGIYRVLVLGDSFTFGEGVKLEHTFAHRLQETLRREASETIEVINVGVSAWSTDSEITYLEKVALGFEPDLVVVVFVPNDADYAGNLDVGKDFRKSYEPPEFLRGSYVLSFVYATISREIVGSRYIADLTEAALSDDANRFKWLRAFTQLTHGRELAASVGSRYAVVVFPFMFQLDGDYPLQAIHQRVAELARRESIPHLDLLDAFGGSDYTSLWVHPSDQHPNERGHEIAARAMADFLIREELIPQD